MAQNIYDDAEFFGRYSQLRRSKEGLSGATEWQTGRALLPPLNGARVLDIGCGFGAFCRYASEQGAKDVLGVDPSEKMLDRARRETALSNVSFECSALEDMQVAAGVFDLVYSALALHYVPDLPAAFVKIAAALTRRGRFVFSMEHPIYTAMAAQSWFEQDGKRLHWPVDNYSVEGERRTAWLKDDVIKYHRTLGSIVTGLIDAGFVLRALIEWGVSAELLAAQPELREELRRPTFLIVAADLG